MGNSLKMYIKSVFPFEKNELGYHILGLIAKKEGLVEYQIVNHLATGTKRTVNNSIKNFLIPHGFLYMIESVESRRNVKNAFGKGKEIKPKKYYLTLKGFVVSLVNVKLKENYVIKKYLEFFPDELEDDVLEYITNEIFIYIFYNHFIGITLNNVNDLVFHIDDTNPRWDLVGISESKKQEIKKIEKKNQLISEKLIKKNSELFNLIEYWADALELITKYKKNEKIIKELEKRTFAYKVEQSEFYEKYNVELPDWLEKKISKM